MLLRKTKQTNGPQKSKSWDEGQGTVLPSHSMGVPSVCTVHRSPGSELKLSDAFRRTLLPVSLGTLSWTLLFPPHTQLHQLVAGTGLLDTPCGGHSPPAFTFIDTGEIRAIPKCILEDKQASLHLELCF